MPTPAKYRLDGKTILVTGASSGIGRACATGISQLGGRVIATGRDENRLNETIGQLQGDGHSSTVFDLSNIEQVSEWVRGLADKQGQLHGLVHMAGIHLSRPLKVTEQSIVNEIFQINVNSAIGLAKAIRHKKVRGNPCSIVLAASVAGMVGEAGISAYSATKGAIISLTKSLAMELARENIRVNCVSPSIVQTPMTELLNREYTPEQLAAIEARHPLGIGQPEDVAGPVAFLLSDAAKWITGTNLVVDGGYTTQ